MWPWEHVAFGYLCYSLYRHARHGLVPGDRLAVAVALGALFPDLVDKPLSWAAGVFPSGYAVGHSIASLAVVAGLAVALRHRGRGRLTGAFVVGYGTHLVGDVVYPTLLGEGTALDRVLWPLVTAAPYEERLGLVARTARYLHRYLAMALSGDIGTALAVQAALLLAVVGLWLYDGTPGLGWARGARQPGERR